SPRPRALALPHAEIWSGPRFPERLPGRRGRRLRPRDHRGSRPDAEAAARQPELAVKSREGVHLDSLRSVRSGTRPTSIELAGMRRDPVSLAEARPIYDAATLRGRGAR